MDINGNQWKRMVKISPHQWLHNQWKSMGINGFALRSGSQVLEAALTFFFPFVALAQALIERMANIEASASRRLWRGQITSVDNF